MAITPEEAQAAKESGTPVRGVVRNGHTTESFDVTITGLPENHGGFVPVQERYEKGGPMRPPRLMRLKDLFMSNGI